MKRPDTIRIRYALEAFNRFRAIDDLGEFISYVDYLEKRLEKQNKVIFDKISKPDTGKWKEIAKKNKQDNNAQYIGAPGGEE